MGELAPLLYRSPRALKRFVNVYRLLKASLRPADRFDYLDATKAPPHHEVVLFLLAVTVGMPSVSRAFFEEVAVYTDDIPDKDAPPADLGELLARMDRSAPDPSKIAGVAWAEEMARIRGWLSARPSKRPFNPHLPQLGYWARRVSRFTYRVNRW